MFNCVVHSRDEEKGKLVLDKVYFIDEDPYTFKLNGEHGYTFSNMEEELVCFGYNELNFICKLSSTDILKEKLDEKFLEELSNGIK